MSEELKIDKGIPVPTGHCKSKGMTYVLRKMEVSDSMFVAGSTPNRVIGVAARLTPWKFLSRTVTENGVKGVRVWRIA